MEGALILLLLPLWLSLHSCDDSLEDGMSAAQNMSLSNLTDDEWVSSIPSIGTVTLAVEATESPTQDTSRPLPDTPYRPATLLALDAIKKKRMQRATVFVCWGSEERYLFELFAAAGVATQVLRGEDFTRAHYVKRALSEGCYHSAVVLDASCPHMRRFLTMASRLRLFYISNFWIIFESGLLRRDSVAAVAAPLQPVVGSTGADFAEYVNVTANRFGAQNREDAIDPKEEAFLEIFPPNRTKEDRDGGFPSQDALLSSGARAALEGMKVFVDSDVLWVQPDAEARAAAGDSHDALQGFEVFRTCLSRPIQAYLVATAGPRSSRWNWTLSRAQEVLVMRKRSDLQGTTMRGSTIIKYPQEYTHIEDNRLRQNDLFPKMNYPVTQNLAFSLNYGILIYKRNNYGWDDGHGTFDGMMGEMQRYEHDMLATAVFIRKDRLPITDMAGETFHMRTAVLFRQPSKSSVSNIFVLPFSMGVWESMGAVSVLAAVVLSFQTQYWKRLREDDDADVEDKEAHDHINIGDCVTFIIGAFCQQGFYCTPKMVSARMTIITTFMASLFLFTSFSGSIVAIIQSPSNAIRTVDDLLSSSMQMGVQEIRFQHVWFQEAKHDMAEKVFKRKIKTHEKPSYLVTQEGIRRMRRGQYAFQVETNEGYKEVLDTFTETEKCDVSELSLFPAAPMCIVTVDKSPYREITSRNVRWQRESGHINRIHRKWESERPGCPFANKGFVPIGLQEFYPVLIVLYNGVALAIAVFLVERVGSTRAVALCVKKLRRAASAAPGAVSPPGDGKRRGTKTQ